MLRTTLIEPFGFDRFLFFFLLQSASFLGICLLVGRGHWQFRLPTILAFSAAMHAVYWFGPPILSDDVFRYRWDGLLTLQGINPLTHTPSEVVHLHPDWIKELPIGHRMISSIYPPLALLSFGGLRFLSGSIYMYGIFYSLLNLFSCLLLHRILGALRKPSSLLIVFAWHPLLALETGHGGHVDAFGVFFLCLGLYLFYHRSDHAWVGVLATFLTKLWPILWLPLFLRGVRRKGWTWFWMAGALMMTACLFYDRNTFTTGTWNYLTGWEFYGFTYCVLKYAGLDAVSARLLLLSVFIVGYVGLLRAYFHQQKPRLLPYMIGTFSLYILCSPTVYPWYALWLVPLLCLHPSWELLAWSLLMVVSYVVLPGYFEAGLWVEHHAWFAIIYGIPLGIWIARRLPRIHATTGTISVESVTTRKGLESQISEKNSR